MKLLSNDIKRVCPLNRWQSNAFHSNNNEKHFFNRVEEMLFFCSRFSRPITDFRINMPACVGGLFFFAHSVPSQFSLAGAKRASFYKREKE
jgi:hypothetical protein